MKENCWEFKKCGKEKHCPAGSLKCSDGFLDGKNGGRACMYVTGTFCGGVVQGTYVEKEKFCGECDFYKQLRKEYLGTGEVGHAKFLEYVKNHGGNWKNK